MNCYVYILLCNDNSFYTGITSNIRRRLYEHNNHIKSCLQKSKLPVNIVYSEIFSSRVEAARCEKEIKGWNRAKKINLIKSLNQEFTLRVEDPKRGVVHR